MENELLMPPEQKPATNKKVFTLNEDQINAFGGRKTAEQVIQNLLYEIKPVNFREYLQLPDNVKTAQKHYVVGVVKRLQEIAKENRWNLAKVYDYVYIFNGCYWLQLEKDELKSMLGEAAMAMDIPLYDARHFDFKDKLLKQFMTDGHLSPPKNKPEAILINLTNGTFEFSPTGGKLRDFDPVDFITNQLPFDYNPAAKCPLFENFLNRVLPDKSCQAVLQEYSGYIFSDLNLEKILMLTGSGSNGKSVFFNIICALVGEENLLNYSLGMFEHEYNRAKLTNKLLNYSSEKGTEINPDTLKILASREPMQAREPYGKSFTLFPKTRFMLNTNELPKLTEQTEAYYRRYLILPFETKISDAEKDIDLADKIIANELPGIFNWLLIGIHRLHTQKKFTHSEKIDFAIEEYKKQSDSVALFIDEKALIPSTTRKDTVAELYQAYKAFCSEDGYKAVSKNKFSTRLENKGFERARLTGGSAAFFLETDYSRE